MDRRVAVGLLLAVLVGLGGCNGVFGPGDGRAASETPVTPAPVPTATAAATDAPGGPAWIESGRLDSEALRRAHRSALANRSFTLVGRPIRPAGADDRTFVVENATTYRLAVGNDTTYADPAGALVREYSRRFGNYTVDADRPVDFRPEQLFDVPFIYLTENVSRIDRVERDGERYYRLVLTAQRAPFDPMVVQYTATAYVTSGGLVETVAFSADLRRQAGHERFGDRWTYRDVGDTTVETPAWVERARRNRTTAQG